jgi:RND family efflux transporter MFP subunit
LRQAEAQLANANAARTLAASVATREEHLVARGISARQALDAARATLAQATAASESARAQVDVARQSVERSHVRAPIAGVVVRLLRRVGEVVDGTPTTPVAEIADPSTLELAASAPARDLVALAVGQPAQLTFDALPGERIAATVRSVSPAVDTATGVGSVRLALQVTRLRPPLGLLGSAEVTTSAPRRVVTVPATAVRNAGGARTEVVVCLGGHAHPRAVEAGLRREGVVEVVRGLDPGAHVATEEIVGLDEGTAIQEAP